MKSPVILRVFKNNQLLEVKQFDQNQIVLGQDAEVHLDLKGEGVSAIHCLIEMRDGGYYISDLGSQTGTFKNGQAVLDSALSSGDEIGVGPYKVVFFFGVPKPAVAGAAPTATVKAPEAKASAPIAKPTVNKPSFNISPPVPKKEEIKSFSKPEIRSPSSKVISSKKNKKTFAPASEVKDLKKYLKPGKGQVVEVIVAWEERILTTYHFKAQGLVRVGPGENYQISLPAGAMSKGWPLLEISGGVRVAVTEEMGFELIHSQGNKDLADVVKTGKGTKNPKGIFVRLDQNEMICLSLMGGKIQVFIRYAPQAPIVPLIPAFLLTGPELTAVVMALVIAGLLAFYISVTMPTEDMTKTEEEMLRTAQIIFTVPPKVPAVKPPPQEPQPPTPSETPPEKVKVGEVKQEKQKQGQPSPQKKAAKNALAGRAAEVAPIPNSQNRPKKFTSTKQGGALKLGEKAGANAQSDKKDLSKAGLFSAFGSGGSRAKLDPSYSGAGGILGQADKATGTSGMDSNRAGDDLGSKFKDTGAGGKGTATEGISGIGTKGRSTGQGLYGSADGFGDKTSVAVEPGDSEAQFVGTIDKEAVRRVIRHNQNEIRGCYVKELNRLERGRQIEGKVVMTWEIVAGGRAVNVKVKSSTLNNKAVENCLRDRIASYTFPDVPAGMTAEVSQYPFNFRAAK